MPCASGSRRPSAGRSACRSISKRSTSRSEGLRRKTGAGAARVLEMDRTDTQELTPVFRRPAGRPKGRQPDEASRARVRELLGDAPRRRDLLIEHLHRIQDADGFLSAAMLAALAEEMRLSQAEVFEVASF